METTDNKNLPDPEAPEEKSFFGIIIHSFFVIPFLIAVFGVLLFAAVRLLTMEQRTIYDYLNDIRAGGLTKRWQAAFELSKLVSGPQAVVNDERFVSEMVGAFEHSKTDDARVRQYLALAMGRTGNVQFVAPLLAALPDEKSENLYSVIYALGMLKDKSAASAVAGFADDPDPKVRLITVMTLGNIGDAGSLKVLKKSLNDSEVNVQWDAAIALAKMKDLSGKGILLKLLDRGYLSQFSEVDAQEQTHILLVAVEAAAGLEDGEVAKAVSALSQNDPNMDVRKAAFKALKNLENFIDKK